MHSLDPQGTQTSLTNHLWLNYSMYTFNIRPYGRCSLELQIPLMQREPGQKDIWKWKKMDTNLVKNWNVTRAPKYQISFDQSLRNC